LHYLEFFSAQQLSKNATDVAAAINVVTRVSEHKVSDSTLDLEFHRNDTITNASSSDSLFK
jgi:hypothetical protein